jgi:hypothetical protein
MSIQEDSEMDILLPLAGICFEVATFLPMVVVDSLVSLGPIRHKNGILTSF